MVTDTLDYEAFAQARTEDMELSKLLRAGCLLNLQKIYLPDTNTTMYLSENHCSDALSNNDNCIPGNKSISYLIFLFNLNTIASQTPIV